MGWAPDRSFWFSEAPAKVRNRNFCQQSPVNLPTKSAPHFLFLLPFHPH